MEDKIHETILEHHSKLSRIETILERVVISNDKLAETTMAISSSLEKLVNFEANTKESFMRVHSRIDEVKREQDDYSKKLEDFEIIRFAIKYPKITALVALGLYALTMDDLRKLILGV